MSRLAISQAPTVAGEDASRVLQRKCDCGNKASAISGECEECQVASALGLQTKLAIGASDDPLELDADRAAAHVLTMSDPSPDTLSKAAGPVIRRRAMPAKQGAVRKAPASVSETLRTPGEPLAIGVRSFFEPRFGHDLSQVRIHNDAQGAASARAVRAHAYTVGNHVVFNSGRYAPNSGPGRVLLAHELAHVIQQNQSLQRDAIAPDPEVRSTPDDADEERLASNSESEETADRHLQGGISGLLQRQADGDIPGLPGDDDLPSGGWPEKDEAAAIRAQAEAERECVESTPPDPAECDPNRALTWADFTGRAPRQRRFGAVTSSSLRERAINTALLRCMPNSAAAQAGPPSRAIQAFFNPARSGVRARFVNPSDPAVNGCRPVVARCERHFNRLARRGQTGDWSMTPGRGCPASAPPRGDMATTRDECATVVARDCNDRAVAESARLLNHEQGHFDLTCAMAGKANAMLSSTTNFTALLRGARRSLSRQQRLYDNQTNHGCVAAQQASWETAIAAGLPDVNITLRSGRRRRRRGRRGRR